MYFDARNRKMVANKVTFFKGQEVLSRRNGLMPAQGSASSVGGVVRNGNSREFRRSVVQTWATDGSDIYEFYCS
jgi:hypothetical protein